ncbi:MAG: B12-binding domain-containing radical SAM protein, partial [Promethearchaeota archaeon]
MKQKHQNDKVFRIMYLFPQEIGKGPDAIYTCFLRISNYLNSKKKELPVEIEDIYIDLRFEELPPFSFQNLYIYLKELKNLLSKIFNSFPFDLVAISCYSSYEYLNSIIVAYLIKLYTNPKVKIIVGGYHPTLYPEEFLSANIPSFIKKYFPKQNILFDFLIKGEGEITFFKLIKRLLNNKINEDIIKNKDGFILEGETIHSLNELPLIDLSLLKRYKEKLKGRRLNIDFGRGCMFRCKICIPTNGTELPFHKNVRFRSIDKCIEELIVIRNTKWLKTNNIFISDPVFFPKRSLRNEFYEKFRNFIKNEGKYPYTIGIYDRVDLCLKEDLLHYKEFDMMPHLGFESASISMLKILNKINSKHERDFIGYIKKLEELIILSNQINLNIWMFLIIGLPGETIEVIKDNRDFFLEQRFNGKSLSELYNIILDIRYYKAIPGSLIYNSCENKYGSKIFFKKWWR